jgi:hypothetical protein
MHSAAKSPRCAYSRQEIDSKDGERYSHSMVPGGLLVMS